MMISCLNTPKLAGPTRANEVTGSQGILSNPEPGESFQSRQQDWTPARVSLVPSGQAAEENGTTGQIHSGWKVGALLALSLLGGCASMGGSQGLEGSNCYQVTSQTLLCQPQQTTSTAHQVGQAIHDNVVSPVSHGLHDFLQGLSGKPQQAQ